MGISAATIDWSGSTGFMNASNSLLIKPTKKLIPVDKRLSDAQPSLYGGHKWVEVKVEEVQRAMRWATTHPKELREQAKRGEVDMQTNFTPEAIAGQITAHIGTYAPSLKTKLFGAVGLSHRVAYITARRQARDSLVRVAKKLLRR